MCVCVCVVCVVCEVCVRCVCVCVCVGGGGIEYLYCQHFVGRQPNCRIPAITIYSTQTHCLGGGGVEFTCKQTNTTML